MHPPIFYILNSETITINHGRLNIIIPVNTDVNTIRTIMEVAYAHLIFILSFSFISHNYCKNNLKAEDNYYLIPQILANSSSSSIHSAVSDTSTLLFSIASFSISIDGVA